MKLVYKPNNIKYTNDSNTTGSQYVIKVSGGFQISDPVKKIHIQTSPNIAKYDITDSLQFLFPANVLNSHLFDDTIIISSETFLENIDKHSILSFGKFENLYCNYQSFIQNKLGHMFSNNSIFSNDSIQTFDKEELYNLLNSKTCIDGNLQSAFTGEIQICNIHKILKNMHQFNIFGNRTSDVYTDKFIARDMFFIPNGISITLKTDLSIESMYISLLNPENANRNLLDWSENNTKTYTGNLLLYLV